MNSGSDWWQKPRNISVVVDNPSWILPYAQNLVNEVKADGDNVTLCRNHNEIKQGDVAFYLGCVKIASAEVLARNKRNLVVHASNLPHGRGFSPWTWQTLEGRLEIPICLLDAADDVDAGDVVFRDTIAFEGHELVDEMRATLGVKHVDLCKKFLDLDHPVVGTPQTGEPDFYVRRRPNDSRLDVDKTLAEQFNLLRVVDNDAYPAFFEFRGYRYKLLIEKMKTDDEG